MKVSEAIYFLNRTLNDIVKPNRFGINKTCIYEGEPFLYSLDYTTEGMVEAYNMRFDDNGIVMMPHYIDHVIENDVKQTHYYSPVKIAHFALGAYNDYIKNNETKQLIKFEKHVNYLINNIELFNEDKNVVIWRTPSSNPKYNIRDDYVSAIVQGLVISALVRAYVMYNDDIYLDVATRAANLLSVPVEDGGVLAVSQWGKSYEEYPSKPYSHVVNGFIFCLIGLKDLHMVSNEESIKDLFETGVETLIKMLDDWILPYWSKYDLVDITRGESVNLATRHYHYLHIDLLQILGLLTNNNIFFRYSDKLSKQMKNPFKQSRIYINKFQKLILKK